MNAFKKALLGLALATCASASYAVALTDTIFVPPNLTGAGTLVSYTFGEGDASVMAGDTFDYDFLLQPPPATPTTSFAFLIEPDHIGDVLFSGVDFSYYMDTTVAGFTLIYADNAVAGSGWLDSGLYDLHVTGTYLAAGAGFSGAAIDDITDLSGTVPEPMSLALMGLGLVGLTAARRRKDTPAALAA